MSNFTHALFFNWVLEDKNMADLSSHDARKALVSIAVEKALLEVGNAS